MARQEGTGLSIPRARLAGVAATVVAGAVAGLLLFQAAVNSSAGLLVAACALGVVFLVLLPGLMLRPRWWWWLLNVVAVAAALVVAVLVFNATCGSNCGDPAAEVNPVIFIPSFTALGAVLGGIQGIGLKGWRQKLIWFAAGAVGGLLFGLFFHRTSAKYSYGDFLRRLIAVIAGGAYGAVVGVTAGYLRAAR
jgi:hypothetical protein